VSSTGLPAACKRTLSLAHDDYTYIRRQRPIFKRIERATQARSEVRLGAALAAQRRLDDRSLAHARQTLRRLRSLPPGAQGREDEAQLSATSIRAAKTKRSRARSQSAPPPMRSASASSKRPAPSSSTGPNVSRSCARR